MEQLLSEETKVIVQAIRDIEGLGFLDKSKGIEEPSLRVMTQISYTQTLDSEGNDNFIPYGKKFQLPLWLALEMQRNGYIKIIVNSEFNKQYSNEFINKAEESSETNFTSISFNKFPYYYEVGGAIARETGDVQLAKSLRQLMIKRMRLIYDEACNSDDTTNNVVRAVTRSEKNLYQTILTVNKEATKIKTSQIDSVKASCFCDEPLSK